VQRSVSARVTLAVHYSPAAAYLAAARCVEYAGRRSSPCPCCFFLVRVLHVRARGCVILIVATGSIEILD